MFRALQTAGLTLKLSKNNFGPKEVQYLGHVLSADGIHMGEDRIKAVRPSNGLVSCAVPR